KISSRKLAARLGISRSTAGRMLAEPSFQENIEFAREGVEQQRAAIIAVDHIAPGKKVLPEKLATLAGVTLDVATRWLADPEFVERLDWARKRKADGEFRRKYGSLTKFPIRIGRRPLNKRAR